MRHSGLFLLHFGVLSVQTFCRGRRASGGLTRMAPATGRRAVSGYKTCLRAAKPPNTEYDGIGQDVCRLPRPRPRSRLVSPWFEVGHSTGREYSGEYLSIPGHVGILFLARRLKAIGIDTFGACCFCPARPPFCDLCVCRSDSRELVPALRPVL